MVVSLEQGADLHSSYGPADATATHCLLLSKTQIGFTFLVLAHSGSPGQSAIKWVCVCVCVCVCLKICPKTCIKIALRSFVNPPQPIYSLFAVFLPLSSDCLHLRFTASCLDIKHSTNACMRVSMSVLINMYLFIYLFILSCLQCFIL